MNSYRGWENNYEKDKSVFFVEHIFLAQHFGWLSVAIYIMQSFVQCQFFI